MGYFILERKHGKVQVFLVAFPRFTTGVSSNKVFRNSVKAAMILSRTFTSSDFPAKQTYLYNQAGTAGNSTIRIIRDYEPLLLGCIFALWFISPFKGEFHLCWQKFLSFV